jgi:hypothetical protein
MSYHTITEQTITCDRCNKTWKIVLEEDDSGAGMWAYKRDSSTHYMPPPCEHIDKEARFLGYTADQRIKITEQ